MGEIFAAKILLFGEYTIITHAQALVTPLDRYSGGLELPVESLAGDPEVKASNLILRDYHAYLSGLASSGQLKMPLDLERFRGELEQGLWFRSDIPSAYGAGSSGALVAAIGSRYGIGHGKEIHQEDLGLLRSRLGQMESFFHGQSSGIDPLCAALRQTLLLAGEEIRLVQLPALPEGHCLFIFDTGTSGSTGPLVSRFNTNLMEKGFRNMVEQDLAPLVSTIIRRFIRGEMSGMNALMHRLSRLQFHHFRPMIPEAFIPFWRKSLEQDLYQIKLCGSGGGGFLMGHTGHWSAAQEHLVRHGIDPHVLKLR